MKRFTVVAALALAAVLPTVRQRNIGDCGGSSRLATAESLVERGTFAIDGSALAWTCDVMEKDGRRYSDKPPLLSVAAAAVYLPLHRLFGLDFDPRARPLGARPPHDPTYGLMTVLVVGLAHAVLVAGFDRAAGRLGLVGARRALLTASLAFATLLWPLSGIFNSHTPAAALVFFGLESAFLLEPARPARAGLLLGLGATVDLPLGGVALAAAALAAAGGRLRLALGALAPLAAHGALNWWIVGDLLPFQMHRELYDSTTGHAGESATGFPQDAGLAFYAARNLFGALGAFSLTPLLLLALPLAVRAARGDGAARRFAAAALCLFASGVVLYVVVWPEAVGCSYGMRHLVPATPPLLLAAGAALGAGRARLWTGLAALSALLAAGGLPNAVTCAGFSSEAHALVPARAFLENLRVEVLPRLRR